MTKKWGRNFGILMLALLALYGLGRFVFPLELYEMNNRLSLKMAGVKTFESVGMHGYEKNFCDPADPEARGCTCVAFIHGLGDDVFTWKKILTTKSTDWKKPVRIFAFDLDHMSHYSAGDAPEAYEVRNQAHEIAKALKPLCPNFMIVGNSMGGWTAAWMAIQNEVPIQRLILSGSAGLRESAMLAMPLFQNLTLEKLKEFQRLAYFKPREIPDNVWSKVFVKLHDAHLEKIIEAQKSEDLLDGSLSAKKAVIHTPTMILWGEADHVLPMASGKQLQQVIPGSLWRQLPQCGHIPQKECTQPYIAALNDMLMYGAI